MAESRHTIILLQTHQAKQSRTFLDYEGVNQAINGVCHMYEQKLRELNPNVPNLTYDIADLYAYIDRLPDLSALVFDPAMQAYVPYGKEWIKKKSWAHLLRMAQAPSQR